MTDAKPPEPPARKPKNQRRVVCEVTIQTDLPTTTLESLTLWSRLFARLGVAEATYVIEARTRLPKQKHLPKAG